MRGVAPNHRIRDAIVLAAFLTIAPGTVAGAEYFLGRSSFNPQADNPLVPGRVYDGSNADRVDDFLRRVPEKSVIRMAKGIFETRGVWDNWLGNLSKGFRLKSGWQVNGFGTNALTGTVIRLMEVPVDGSGLYNFNAVFSTGGVGLYDANRPPRHHPNVDDVTIRDLQIDCNYPGLARTAGTPALQVAGIQILGNRGIKIINVLVRNAASKKVGGQDQALECFQVYAYNAWATNFPGDYFLDRVAIAEYRGGYTSAICLNGNATGVVQNCTINLVGDRSQRYGINFAAGLHHFTIRSNVVLNATRGINNDTGPVCEQVTLHQNQLLDCATGMLLEDSQHCMIRSNIIVLDGSGTGIAVRFHPALPNPKSGGCVIAGNKFIGSQGEGISLAYLNEWNTRDQTLFWSSQNIIQDNVFSPTLQNKVPPEILSNNIIRPGNRRQTASLAACPGLGGPANASAIGFPSDIGSGAPCGYCAAKATDTSYGFISRVRLVGTELDMRCDGGDGSGYNDFTTGYGPGLGVSKFRQVYAVQYADVHRGRAYRIIAYASALRHPASAFVRVYADWDHDGQFKSVSEVFPLSGSGTVRSGTIAVPGNAPLGSTRMRVVLNCGRIPSPCDYNAFSGEVEDYTITVLP